MNDNYQTLKNSNPCDRDIWISDSMNAATREPRILEISSENEDLIVKIGVQTSLISEGLLGARPEEACDVGVDPTCLMEELRRQNCALKEILDRVNYIAEKLGQ